jgi:hypothetical protein
MTTGLDSLPRGLYAILHIRSGTPYPDPQTSPRIAANTRFELTGDTWIETLESEFAVNIQRACEPPNFNINNLIHDRHLYAFIRSVPENEVPRYKGVNDLITITALSRLIHPTSVGNRYCVNAFKVSGADFVIQALSFHGTAPDVFVGDGSRDWLSPNDGMELRKLMPWVSTSKVMHPRVHRAYWSHELAMRTYYLDVRWMFVVSGLEALLNVDERGVRRQFVGRGEQLAIELGVHLSEDELHKAYTLRSKLVHAESFLVGLDTVLSQSEHKPLYDKLELLLRSTVKRCLLDEAFGDHFSSDAAVEAQWG